MSYLKKLEKYLETNTAKIRINMNEMHTYWGICFVCGFFVFEISLIINLNPITSEEGIQYLLSAISQALAAVFTLVFTISLMVATMAGKYTAIDKILNRSTISLIGIFATGIILPILLLNIDSTSTHSYGFFVSLSTGLAAFCIIVVIPYLISLNNVFKFDIEASNLISKLHESIAAEEYAKANTVVYDLLDIGKSAIENKREEPTWTIGIQISNFVKLALSRQGGILPSFSPQISIYALSEMGVKAINAQMDKVAVSFLHDLRDVGVLLIPKGFDSSVENVIFNIHNIGILAIEHKLILTSTYSLNSLLDIAHEASSEGYKKHLSEKSYNYFGICAANFEKYYPEEADRACVEIKLRKIDIDQILPKERKDRINKQNPELAGFVDKFINRFNSN